MSFPFVPRITATLRLGTRRDKPPTFLWGLGLGVIAGLVLAAAAVDRLTRHATPQPHESDANGVSDAPRESTRNA